MPTYNPLFSRSPFFEQQTGTAAQEVKVELYIWNDPASEPATPTYTLSKPIPSANALTVTFDVSPYIREYIKHTNYTEVTTDTAANVNEYCRCTIKTYLDSVLQLTSYKICFNGYGYFEDGYNPTLTTTVPPPHLTEGTYYVSDTGNTGGLYYNDNQVVTWEARYTGLSTAGVTLITLANEVGYIPYVHSSYVGEGNKLEIIRNTVVIATYTFEEVCEQKYTIYNCDFVNRYGAWQRLIFFKASQKDMAMKNTEFNLMPDSVNYNTYDNIKQSFNTNAQESITVNTGWVVEGYSEVMKELLLSEKILLNNEPVKLTTKNVRLQTHLNDKTINYNVKFDYANEMLNYII